MPPPTSSQLLAPAEPLGTSRAHSQLVPFFALRSWFILIVFVLSTLACSNSPVSPRSVSTPPSPEQARQLQNATALQAQAQTLLDQGRYMEALAPGREALLIRERILGPTSLDVATALTTLGLIHGTLIELPQATHILERALAIRRSLLAKTDVLVGESLTNLGTVQYAAGDFVRAIHTLEEALAIRKKALGSSHPDVAITLTHLAIAQRGMSRLEQARASAERAISILQVAQPPRQRDLAMAVNVTGNILGRLGQFETAHTMLERSVQLYEQTLGSHHPNLAGAMMQLAMLEGKQGNPTAALQLLERVLVITEQSYGRDNPEVAGTLYEIGLMEFALGRHADAERRFERTLAIQEAKIDPAHPFIALTLVELADIRQRRGDETGARALLERALGIQEHSLGHEHPSLARTLTSLGYLEARRHNLPLAEAYFDRTKHIRERALGTNHRDVATSLIDLARAKHALGNRRGARETYERGRQILQSQQGLNLGLPDEALSLIWKKDLKGLQDYALLLADLAVDATAGPEQRTAVTDGFLVSQQARGWLMQAAVARVLAQQATGDSSTASLAKRLDDLSRTRQDLWAQLNGLYALAETQRSPQELASAQQALSTVQHELDQASIQLKAVSPRYAELAQPEALDIQEVQRLLEPNEALVGFYTLGDRLQIWLVRRGQPVLYRASDVARDQLIQLVRQVRSGLQPGAGSTDKTVRPMPFDVSSAARLYELLFAPIATQLFDIQNLIIVPDEVLLPLPFATLITDQQGEAFPHLSKLYRHSLSTSPDDLQWYSSIPWLAKRYALTILPSTSALKLVRRPSPGRDEPGDPFLGFGDPVLHGEGEIRGGAMVASRGRRVPVESLRALSPLPGTHDELQTIAKLFKVRAETNLFLGPRAIEPEVRRLNASGRLGRAKVIAFATHGLLAGEVQGVTQPSLVLTPPAVPTEEDDGLLSLEDVLQLRLPWTDWVILSACNTAGDNGSGESLSGLARAFFFAGARTLLVSQWSVDDRATKVLMTEIFQGYASNLSKAPSSALQSGMQALMTRALKSPEDRYFAHPYAWAPFMVVGDGQLSAH